MTTDRISFLFTRYMDGSATDQEKLELAAVVLRKENEALIKELESEYWNSMEGSSVPLSQEEVTRLMEKIVGKDKAPVRSIVWRRIAVAASILLVVGLGSYRLFFYEKNQPADIFITPTVKDVKAPAANRAMITLADGSTVYLDSAANGQLAQQGNIQLVKLANGQIAYQAADGQFIEKAQYNTLTNPRGSKVIDMQLADGSHVWLNAGSSITYPVAFVEEERKLVITGEAYFEVAASVKEGKKQKFLVEANGVTTEVLGTHFNVNAYEDEERIKVTLLEGSVKVSNRSDSKIIKPGQQASVVAASPLTVKSVDVEEVMAWKNGKFRFGEAASIEEIMRQLARWYDVEIVYSEKVKGHIGGSISRDVNISQVLKMLAMTGGVQFEIQGKKVIVKP